MTCHGSYITWSRNDCNRFDVNWEVSIKRNTQGHKVKMFVQPKKPINQWLLVIFDAACICTINQSRTTRGIVTKFDNTRLAEERVLK